MAVRGAPSVLDQLSVLADLLPLILLLSQFGKQLPVITLPDGNGGMTLYRRSDLAITGRADIDIRQNWVVRHRTEFRRGIHNVNR